QAEIRAAANQAQTVQSSRSPSGVAQTDQKLETNAGAQKRNQQSHHDHKGDGGPRCWRPQLARPCPRNTAHITIYCNQKV
ncbi:MAG: hypothetical protein ACKPKO_49535, partial [Candidatus Fonsibacter sp.]